MSVTARINRILAHLATGYDDRCITEGPTAGDETAAQLGLFLDPKGDRQLSTSVRAAIHKSKSLRSDPSELSMATLRDLVFQQAQDMQQIVLSHGIELRAYRDAPRKIFDSFGPFISAIRDISTGTQMLQTMLFGLAVLLLGTDRHAKYYGPIDRYEMLGCFALTELGHGSNVQALETRANYNPDSKTFTINSPTVTSQKYYIGGAAMRARWSVLFAQLFVKGKYVGLHPFLVQLRNDDGSTLPGVKINDCGAKGGLNGVDNGAILLSNVSVPLENLLDRYGTIDAASGDYKSHLPTPTHRSMAYLAALVLQRVFVGVGQVEMTKVALATSIKYALNRRAFKISSSGSKQETLLLDYVSHQRRLFPRLATTYVVSALVEHCKSLMDNRSKGISKDDKMLHVYAAMMKAYGTWTSRDTLQICREACGGQGFMARNKITLLRRDSDVYTTFDGDNTMLYQQLSKHLLEESFRSEATHTQKKGVNINDALVTLDTLLDSLVARQQFYVQSLREAIATKSAKGMDQLMAWNDSQDVGFAAAQAFCERFAFQCFAARVKALENQRDIPEILNALGRVYILSIWETDAWFFGSGYLEGGSVLAIKQALRQYYETIRRNAHDLVEAFGIPLEDLGTIAGDWETAAKF